jgi:hypothetical protein
MTMIRIMLQRVAVKAPLNHALRTMCVLVCLCSMAVHIAYGAQPLDSWTFNDADRPVKAVAIGDSIAAYTQGSFVAFLQAACPHLEVVNLAKPMIGADAIRERLIRYVLRNPRINLHNTPEVWMIYQGGVNSVEDPALTNHYIRWTFVDAHRAGLNIMAMSLLPWGSEHDRRWRETHGLKTWSSTRHVVDFVMGRLSPTEALGPYTKNHPARWQAEELPDIAVDVYDSPLRDRDAPLRQFPDVRTMVRQSPWIQAQLHGRSEVEQEEQINAYVRQTLALPRWFLRERFQAFDHFHPNHEGHRLVAQLACDKAPETWGCHCGAIRDMRWNPQKGGLEPIVTFLSTQAK